MATRIDEVTSFEEAERLWDQGQEIAASLERLAGEQADEAERERLGDLADGLRGL